MPARLYTVPLPEATRPKEQDTLGTRIAEQGVLNKDTVINALSTQAADLSLSGEYAYGRYFSELLATELEELANSQFAGLPLVGGAGARWWRRAPLPGGDLVSG